MSICDVICRRILYGITRQKATVKAKKQEKQAATVQILQKQQNVEKRKSSSLIQYLIAKREAQNTSPTKT